MPPSISVIMPVYNAGKFLKESIESILQQSFTNFEFFIIDDASTDNSVEIIQSYTDKRIRFIQKEFNTGYTDSLNMAVQLSKGKYIARMDADDISFKHRFQQQFQFMESHTEVLVLGTAYKIIDTNTIVQLPITNEEAKIVAMMNVPVAHPTVLIRKEVFDKYGLWYNKKYEPSEDYDLWTRVLEKGSIENLPGTFLYYRRHPEQQSISRYHKLMEATLQIRTGQLNKIIDFSNKPYDILFAIDVLAMKPLPITGMFLKNTAMLLSDLLEGNQIKNIYDKIIFCKYLRSIWLFYILKFDTPLLTDISLLQDIRRFEISRTTGWVTPGRRSIRGLVVMGSDCLS